MDLDMNNSIENLMKDISIFFLGKIKEVVNSKLNQKSILSKWFQLGLMETQ